MGLRAPFVYRPSFLLFSQSSITFRQRVCTPLAGVRLQRYILPKLDETSSPDALVPRYVDAYPPPKLLTIRDIPAPHIGSIRVIGLNSPANRNAMSKRLLRELGHQIVMLDGTDGRCGWTRVLILTSEVDEVFCAGADLKERRDMNSGETMSFLTSLNSMLDRLSGLKIPTIAAISSVALGGGLELALATTFRVFSTTATVGLPETRLGIIPGAGGTYRLKKLIGQARAQRMILTACRITGRTAHDWGLCEWVATDQAQVTNDQRIEHGDDVPKGEHDTLSDRTRSTAAVLDLAVDIAKDICRGAPVAVGAAMTAVRMGNKDSEEKMYKRCMVQGKRDRAEGLRAFDEKRPPNYTGAPTRAPDTHKLSRAIAERHGHLGRAKNSEGHKDTESEGEMEEQKPVDGSDKS